jgi:DNA-binding NtrC family response regulator
MSAAPFPRVPILIVDDEPSMLTALASALASSGMANVVTCQDSRNVEAMLAKHEYETILLDLTMPYVSGQELLPVIRKNHPEIPVIIITGATEVTVAVECMKQGVFDYLVKAVEKSKLVATVNKAVQIRELQRENSSLSRHLVDGVLEHPEYFEEIVTGDGKMRSVLMYVESIATTAQTVLISGETGSGKELVAKAIHRASGRSGEIVSVNISGLDESMFADTLFGHLKGAYTGADQIRRGLIDGAADGTLFLDEIGELSHPSQVRLLRLLESNEYYPLGSDVARRSNARIVVATNRNLEEEAAKGSFRKDLYYRLRTHRVEVPPLRERPKDIRLLVDHYLERAAHELGKELPPAPQGLYALMESYSFPGNVRELKSIIFDAASRHKQGELSLGLFEAALGKGTRADRPRSQELFAFTDGFPTLHQATEYLVKTALERSGGNQAKAARLLGISPQALNKRLKGARE